MTWNKNRNTEVLFRYQNVPKNRSTLHSLLLLFSYIICKFLLNPWPNYVFPTKSISAILPAQSIICDLLLNVMIGQTNRTLEARLQFEGGLIQGGVSVTHENVLPALTALLTVFLSLPIVSPDTMHWHDTIMETIGIIKHVSFVSISWKTPLRFQQILSEYELIHASDTNCKSVYIF